MFEAFEALVTTATGPSGLVLIFGYSVLVAFVLPLPGELVLLAAPRLGVFPSTAANVALVIFVSAVGKAIGSVWALRIGRGALGSGPAQWLRTHVVPNRRHSGIEGRLTAFVHRYEYVGLTLVLAVPLLPDTAVVYAFSAIDGEDRYFAVAAFVGTVARLCLALALATGVLAAV